MALAALIFAIIAVWIALLALGLSKPPGPPDKPQEDHLRDEERDIMNGAGYLYPARNAEPPLGIVGYTIYPWDIGW